LHGYWFFFFFFRKKFFSGFYFGLSMRLNNLLLFFAGLAV